MTVNNNPGDVGSKNQTPLLKIRNLNVEFGPARNRFRAVNSLSFDVFPGERLAIVGESGSGKSVSSLSLLGLLPASSHTNVTGSAEYAGSDLTKLSENELRHLRGNRIAMIFQEPMTSLNPVLTIGRQMTESLIEHQGLSKQEAWARGVELLEQVRLTDPAGRMKQYPHQLSGGMRQRVMIAMALANDPEILIADEPTTALDVTVQAQILKLMSKLCEEHGTSLILITHDMGVVAETADRVLVMKGGQLVEEATVKDIFASPQHPYTQKLLESVPKLGSMRETDGPRIVVKPDAIVERTASDKPLVEASGLGKTFTSRQGDKVVAMDDITFTLNQGETLALVGESGSGKSTTGRAVLRLLDPDAGSLKFEGQEISKATKGAVRPLRREMQMIFQDPLASLNPRMRASYLVAEPMMIHGIAQGSELNDRVEELFLRVGLTKQHLRRYPHEFSGGQRQRLCIARALGVGPKLIVADEPTSALDVSVQAQVLELMLSLQQSMGLSYLFVSHDMAVIEQVSHRVAVMHHGKIVEIGPRREVLNNPRHPYTQALLAAVPVPDPLRKKGTLPKIDFRDSPRGPLLEVAPDHMVAS